MRYQVQVSPILQLEGNQSHQGIVGNLGSKGGDLVTILDLEIRVGEIVQPDVEPVDEGAHVGAGLVTRVTASR